MPSAVQVGCPLFSHGPNGPINEANCIGSDASYVRWPEYGLSLGGSSTASWCAYVLCLDLEFTISLFELK